MIFTIMTTVRNQIVACCQPYYKSQIAKKESQYAPLLTVVCLPDRQLQPSSTWDLDMLGHLADRRYVRVHAPRCAP